ncbi:uncharacterized protein BDZ99DRAFT_146319 [Mytilinidion resinicola]|uniref:Uncharacterized protein n=1 Tax=Mytilinidion resinicola TaxID=574789 RepID=A0A6A6Y821_9PEZI|nr:uncharacterized protein BDZ99DRAFT_146319 [Mytilinidion resinicola]KAF2804962.1 hypothetical protein BDZ99DRAFT_146319 [Mytilinidion resinicola]
MTGRSINNLSISRYIIQVLDRWAAKQPYFEDVYRSLLFGSLILIHDMASNIEDVEVQFLPNTRFVQSVATVNLLQDTWNLAKEAWPPMIHLDTLRP